VCVVQRIHGSQGAYDSAVHTPARLRGVAVLAVLAALAGCVNVNPSPPASSGITPTPASSTATVAPSASSSPTAPEPVAFPLAVVTGLTNLKANVTLDELASLASRGRLVVPCGVTVEQPTLTASGRCVAGDRIAGELETHPKRVALLPPGLVEPATKVLSIAGSGPFGMFGPDLFGDPKARARHYPVIGSALAGDPTIEPAWTAYDASQIWTMTSIGSLCADRNAAYQAVTLGKGWDWVFGGGTARYQGSPVVDPPDPPPYVFSEVPLVDTGHAGVTPRVLKRSDVAIADHECPIMPSAGWEPNVSSSALVFSVPEDVLPLWKNTLGLDAVYLAANHMSDRGVDGIRSTLEMLDAYGIPRTGLGMNLDEALEPAYIEVAGLRVALVAFNDVNGVARAEVDTPGVPWITRRNVSQAVRRARAGGADLVICDPQWWGGAEYHDDLWPVQVEQLGWFDDAGCDHVIGAGTHVAGPMLLRKRPNDTSLVLASPGNYMFGQNWWQEVEEGVILDMTFRGKTLVNVRLRPYAMLDAARASLLDPEGDGRYVQQRIWQYSDVDY
jgi:capsule synthesis protein PGA_cap